MTCPTCGGTVYRDWEDIRCLACGRSPLPVSAPAVPAPFVRSRKAGNRTSKLDSAAVERIKTVMALARWGMKADAARQLAAEYGLSAAYIRDIGLGKQLSNSK